MIKIKRIFSLLSLMCMVTTGSVFAMEENPGQVMTQHLIASSCWNALSGVTNVAYYGVNMVVAEAKYIPDVINSVLIHMTSHDEYPDNVKTNTNGFNLSVNHIYQGLTAVQNGAYFGANCAYSGAIYAHDAINALLKQIALAEDRK